MKPSLLKRKPASAPPPVQPAAAAATPRTDRPNRLKLKPIAEQVIVITGATSGIGLSTARAAAARGARLVLTARNADALRTVREGLVAKGVRVACLAADVADPAALRAVADLAIAEFGGFDTWVNNAGVSIFGAITKTPTPDHRRLFEINYWGLVEGSLIAVEHFKTREGGGALINLGSALGDVALPLQGAYGASKHAVKAFTQALRMELVAQRAPVSVTLIKPSAIDTPYKDHARNLTGMAMRNPPPIYATPLVAQAILYAAEHRVRALTVGASGQALALVSALAPFLVDPLLVWAAPGLSRDRSGRRRTLNDNLYQAGPDLRERSFQGPVRENSLYSAAQMRPKTTVTLAVMAGLAASLAFRLGLGHARRDAEAPRVKPNGMPSFWRKAA